MLGDRDDRTARPCASLERGTAEPALVEAQSASTPSKRLLLEADGRVFDGAAFLASYTVQQGPRRPAVVPPGARIWQASPHLYARLRHIMFAFSSRAMRLRSSLKSATGDEVPRPDVASNEVTEHSRVIDAESMDVLPSRSPTVLASHPAAVLLHGPPLPLPPPPVAATMPQFEFEEGRDSWDESPPVEYSNLLLDRGWREEIQETNRTRIDDEDEIASCSSLNSEFYYGLHAPPSGRNSQDNIDDHSENSETDSQRSRSEGDDDDAVPCSAVDDVCGASAGTATCDGTTEAPPEDDAAEVEKCKGTTDGDVAAIGDTDSLSPMARLFCRWLKSVDGALDLWQSDESLPLHNVDSSVSGRSQWMAVVRRDLHRIVALLRYYAAAPHSGELSRDADTAALKRILRVLNAVGFGDNDSVVDDADNLTVSFADTACYSYHPRIFSTMSTLNANFGTFQLCGVLAAESSDVRAGRAPIVPVPHPNPTINTRVILCEPRKKKGVVDDFPFLPHPKRAVIHGVEDLIVEEELRFRHLVHIKTHMNAHGGSLRGLAPHLAPLVFHLVDEDESSFSRLLSASGNFFIAKNVPASLSRQIAAKLESELGRMHASREAVRGAVGTIGFYGQSVSWRDQALSALRIFNAKAPTWLGLTELAASLQSPPILVGNPWGCASNGRKFLEGALGAICEADDHIGAMHESITFLTDLLRGTWLAKSHSQSVGGSRAGEFWDSSWGPFDAESAATYLVTPAVVSGIQSLLGLCDVLLAATHNSHTDDHLSFLKGILACNWRSDAAVAEYLLQRELTSNICTAKLVAIGTAVDGLRLRLPQVHSARDRCESLSVGGWSADSGPHYPDPTPIGACARLILPGAPLGSLLPPVLAITNVIRYVGSEVAHLSAAMAGGGGFDAAAECDINLTA